MYIIEATNLYYIQRGRRPAATVVFSLDTDATERPGWGAYISKCAHPILYVWSSVGTCIYRRYIYCTYLLYIHTYRTFSLFFIIRRKSPQQHRLAKCLQRLGRTAQPYI